jgi:hypothetical protein
VAKMYIRFHYTFRGGGLNGGLQIGGITSIPNHNPNPIVLILSLIQSLHAGSFAASAIIWQNTGMSTTFLRSYNNIMELFLESFSYDIVT